MLPKVVSNHGLKRSQASCLPAFQLQVCATTPGRKLISSVSGSLAVLMINWRKTDQQEKNHTELMGTHKNKKDNQVVEVCISS